MPGKLAGSSQMTNMANCAYMKQNEKSGKFSSEQS